MNANSFPAGFQRQFRLAPVFKRAMAMFTTVGRVLRLQVERWVALLEFRAEKLSETISPSTPTQSYPPLRG